VLYNCLSWYKFVNTHLYHSRQLYNIQIYCMQRAAIFCATTAGFPTWSKIFMAVTISLPHEYFSSRWNWKACNYCTKKCGALHAINCTWNHGMTTSISTSQTIIISRANYICQSVSHPRPPYMQPLTQLRVAHLTHSAIPLIIAY